MLDYPNPLRCLVNLVWKSAVGESALESVFNRQSYMVQCILAVTAAVVVAMLVYNSARKLPAFFITLAQLPDLHRKETFEELQRRMSHQRQSCSSSNEPFRRAL